MLLPRPTYFSPYVRFTKSLSFSLHDSGDSMLTQAYLQDSTTTTYRCRRRCCAAVENSANVAGDGGYGGLGPFQTDSRHIVNRNSSTMRLDATVTNVRNRWRFGTSTKIVPQNGAPPQTFGVSSTQATAAVPAPSMPMTRRSRGVILSRNRPPFDGYRCVAWNSSALVVRVFCQKELQRRRNRPSATFDPFPLIF